MVAKRLVTVKVLVYDSMQMIEIKLFGGVNNNNLDLENDVIKAAYIKLLQKSRDSLKVET